MTPKIILCNLAESKSESESESDMESENEQYSEGQYTIVQYQGKHNILYYAALLKSMRKKNYIIVWPAELARTYKKSHPPLLELPEKGRQYKKIFESYLRSIRGGFSIIHCTFTHYLQL